jgi:hypothetical protein
MNNCLSLKIKNNELNLKKNMYLQAILLSLLLYVVFFAIWAGVILPIISTPDNDLGKSPNENDDSRLLKTLTPGFAQYYKMTRVHTVPKTESDRYRKLVIVSSSEIYLFTESVAGSVLKKWKFNADNSSWTFVAVVSGLPNTRVNSEGTNGISLSGSTFTSLANVVSYNTNKTIYNWYPTSYAEVVYTVDSTYELYIWNSATNTSYQLSTNGRVYKKFTVVNSTTITAVSDVSDSSCYLDIYKRESTASTWTLFRSVLFSSENFDKAYTNSTQDTLIVVQNTLGQTLVYNWNATTLLYDKLIGAPTLSKSGYWINDYLYVNGYFIYNTREKIFRMLGKWFNHDITNHIEFSSCSEFAMMYTEFGSAYKISLSKEIQIV